MRFDNIKGPIISYSVPSEVSNRKEEVLKKLMDISETGYFEHTNKSGEKFTAANHTFYIKSDWGRGNVETLMLSLIVDEGQKPSVFQSTLEEYVSFFEKVKNLYKGFYVDSKHTDTQIPKFNKRIMALIKDCFEDCRKNPAGQKPGIMSILGIQAVGKTSILNCLTEEKFKPKVKPTLGTQIIRSIVDNFKFKIYDVGGQERLRKKWFAVPPPNALIYVMAASANSDQQKESKKEFDTVINHYFGKNSKQKLPKNTPVLILANKIDLNDSFTEKDIRKILKPDKQLNFKIGLCSALEDVGIDENFKWLVKEFLFV